MEFKFDNFKSRAKDNSLSKWEKIGFPDSYRKGREVEIFNDINLKLSLDKGDVRILDIGCGCGDLVNILALHSIEKKNQLDLVDSLEMLENIDSKEFKNNSTIRMIPGRFPEEMTSFVDNSKNKYDAIIVYSVIQYVFLESSIFWFIHCCLKMLKSGGKLLIGDIPNNSMRERFLRTTEGSNFINENKESNSIIHHENFERMDDSVVLAILARFRSFDCETYVLPQSSLLPFSNRREDILIMKR
jgi:2-polyprenyl-3-methyl-5-hydroxy-6-metoxy-1,4-benzoquinol methylase